VLIKTADFGSGSPSYLERFHREGFTWLPIITKNNGMICKLEVLMLRHGNPGGVLYDIDNRLKTLFDALRIPTGPQELGAGTSKGVQSPDSGEDPFYRAGSTISDGRIGGLSA
jgi:hypothetical protein